MQNKINNLIIEKKSIEEKNIKITESYQKIISGGKVIKAQNSIEMVENLKKNDITKILSKYKGTEKLIQLLKDGYNETVRELIFEISALKNYVFELNNEFVNYIQTKSLGKGVKILDNFLEMPFLDTIYKIKNIINNNLSIVMNNPSKQTNLIKDNFIENDESADYGKNDVSVADESNLKISQITKKESLFDDFDENEEVSHNLSNKKNKLMITNDDNLNERSNIDYNELEVLKKKWIQTLMGKNEDNK